jgi:hypothetical protein
MGRTVIEKACAQLLAKKLAHQTKSAAYLIRWARGKFKRLRGQSEGARQWLARVRRAKPMLFPHWRFFNVGSRTSEAV